MNTITLHDADISIDETIAIIQRRNRIDISEDFKQKVLRCRAFLEEEMSRSNRSIYGINTGFGALCNVKIADHQLSELQHNLVRSHACGMGAALNDDLVRLLLLLKIRSLAYGHSGVKLETIERLIFFFNHEILPIVYEQGSLGASGDLAPLAHLSLPLFGEGKVRVKGEIMDASQLEVMFGIKPLQLAEKEGLALLNGTQFMAAHGVWAIHRAQELFEWSVLISALSCEAFDCKTEPFNPLIHKIRPHKGQQLVAEKLRAILQNSTIAQRLKMHVQDPYSFRCIPQVLGASYDVLKHAKRVFETEINSVTDNPNIFPDEQEILSGGNFHGQPLALAMDYLAMAVHEAGNIAERRIYQLVSGKRELPMFLSANPGLQSGIMIPQYTAASLVNQNKHLANPCSTDSIESSAGQEDHVSMGANAATKLMRVVDNLEKILGIELLTASQAIEFRRPVRSSPIIEKLLTAYRQHVSFIDQDRILHEDMRKSCEFITEHGAADFIGG
ncbi:MAG: histidine ammonia-lyase [Flavobacteriales bacterium]